MLVHETMLVHEMLTLLFYKLVMPGLDPPAGPKPLRRGEGPGIHQASKMLLFGRMAGT